MRVIAGSARGTRLISPEGLDVRPTLDRIREAVFGSLQFVIAGADLLDLFAGTGALGIEGLSRGAAHCTFVDISRASLDVVRQNLERTRLTDRAALVNAGFEHALLREEKRFDVIFLDPPYKSGFYDRALDDIIKYDRLAPGGRVVCESTGEIAHPGFAPVRVKSYGEVVVTFLGAQ